jgi:ATP-dependent Lon protease
MPSKKKAKSKSSKKKYCKKYLKRTGGNGGKDDDNDSVDSQGNLRDFIDYGSDGSDDSDPEATESESEAVEPTRSSRPQRKSAMEAQKKIKKYMEEEEAREKKHWSKRLDKLYEDYVQKRESKREDKKKPKNKIIVPKQRTRQLTPHKRVCPFRRNKKYHKRHSPVSTTSTETTESSDTTTTSEPSEESKTDTEYTEEESIEEYDTADVTDETEPTDVTEEEATEEEEEESEDLGDSDTETDEDDAPMDVEEEEDEEYKEENEAPKGISSIILALGAPPGHHHDMVPKKHNMKKESEVVKKFVKLLTAPVDDNGIDAQITQFKALPEDKQKELIYALEHRPTVNDTGINLMLKILTLKVSPEVQGMILSKYNSLQNLDNSSGEYYKVRNWLDKAVSLPFGIYKEVPARLDDGPEKCHEFMKGAKKCLDDAVYGQEESKLQIMQFISTKIANPDGRGLSLLFIGPPGVGKTTIIKNGIAKALGWPFQFISLGGDSDASTYTGHQLVYESSHCGKIVNSLIASKSMSTVLMFDEVDKISQTPKGEEVMNLLIHLTDPVQNADFEDKYLAGIPIDLSKVMFVFSANDITKIDRVLLDRMTVVNLQGYDLKQKIVIAEQYLLPAALKEVNLTERIHISKEVLASIISEYASDDKGIRELKRCIEQITQKINMLRMYNSPDLPFHIKDFCLPFIVKKDHLKLFLKKKENPNAPPPGWYI